MHVKCGQICKTFSFFFFFDKYIKYFPLTVKSFMKRCKNILPKQKATLVVSVGGWAIGMATWWSKPPCQWSSHWRSHFGGLIIGVTILVAISIIGPLVLVAPVTEPLILVVHLKIL